MLKKSILNALLKTRISCSNQFNLGWSEFFLLLVKII
jgi:hypothetical protein